MEGVYEGVCAGRRLFEREVVGNGGCPGGRMSDREVVDVGELPRRMLFETDAVLEVFKSDVVLEREC